MIYPQSTAVQAQITQFLMATQAMLAENLVGVYVHGSLAMGCFQPGHSDLDLLVVTRQPMIVATKRAVAELLLELSGDPAPIEISYLSLGMLQPWQHPTPFDFHYSDMWRNALRRDIEQGTWQQWNATQQRDPDLAAHLTMVRERGVVLCGAPIAEVFPLVPRADYLDSIRADVGDALAAIVEKPGYAILNVCRVLAYLDNGGMYSKAEGAQWALEHLPPSLRQIVQHAYDGYVGATPPARFEQSQLAAFQAYAQALLATI